MEAAINESQERKQILVLAAGWGNADTFAYDTSSDTWASVASMSCQREGPAATLWQGKVIVAGGWNRTNNYLRTVEQFDPESNTWTALPDMLHKRKWCALACLDDTLYAIGGRDKDFESQLDTVERYDPQTKRWQLAASLNARRDGLCSVVLDVGVLAIGGHDESERLDTCELLDGVKQKWEFVASLQTARSNALASIVDDRVYVFGGLDRNDKFLHSVEEYAAGKWTLLPVRLSVAKCRLAAATVNGRVYVCGGYPDGKVVECFDSSQMQIRRVSQLPKELFGAAAVSMAVSEKVWSQLFGLARH